MRKSIYPLLFLIIPLIMSCGDSSPTSDNAKTYKVEGSVTDKIGAGVWGVAVQISGTNFSLVDTTDSAGVFAFKKIPSGSYTVKALKENGVFKPSGIDLAVADSNIDTLKFVAAENRIHGKVIDIITNKGMADIMIYIEDNIGHDKTDSTKTDINGEYEFFNLPVNEYEIFQPSQDVYKKGSMSPFVIYVKETEFAVLDITVQDFFISSEILQITSATFSEETNTVHLEWTPTKSNYFDEYEIFATDKLPLGSFGNNAGVGSKTNNVSIEITPRFHATLKNAKIIHFAVYVGYYNYFKNTDLWGWIGSPYSEPVSIRVAG